MTAITTNLKALVQARIDALTSETTITDLMLLRKAAAGLGCDESALNAKVSAALAAFDPDTPLKDLLLGSKAADAPSNAVSVGDAIYSMSNQLEFERGGATFLRSGHIQLDTDKFDTEFFKEKLVPSNAVTVTKTFAATDNISSDVAYGDGADGPIYAWCASNGQFFWSQDDFATVNVGTGSGVSTGTPIACAFLSNKFLIADGKQVRYSANGKAWTSKNWTGSENNPYAQKWLHGNGLFVLLLSNVSSANTFAVIDDGMEGSWLLPPMSATGAVHDAVFHNGYFYISTNANTIIRTADFVTFDTIASNIPNGRLASGNGRLICAPVTENADISVSDDNGDTWSRMSTLRPAISRYASFVGGVFVYASTSGLWTSATGANWIKALTVSLPAAAKFTASDNGVAFSYTVTTQSPRVSLYQPLTRFAGALTAQREGDANQYVRTK
ncbi:hypothetical protein [Rheinheimera sp.]|uniref:hypothetical protein n=1 Tax=Rheinheimera sp. TaxID=1869214 RepID=UPI00307EB639